MKKPARCVAVMLASFPGLMSGEIARADTPVPAALSPGPDMQLVLSARGDGVQVYDCSQAKNEWQLKGPDAKLLDPEGKQIGKHFDGPSWALNDGSLITAEVAASEHAPDGKSVAWLLLKVKTNNGKGLLAEVGAVQRIDTVGGLAPKGSCKQGDEFRSPYTATYRFFGSKD